VQKNVKKRQKMQEIARNGKKMVRNCKKMQEMRTFFSAYLRVRFEPFAQVSRTTDISATKAERHEKQVKREKSKLRFIHREVHEGHEKKKTGVRSQNSEENNSSKKAQSKLTSNYEHRTSNFESVESR